MAGTLIINEKEDWLPPGWVYDDILEEIAAELSPKDSDLSTLLRGSKTDITGFCDLTRLDAKKFRALVEAAERARNLTVSKGAAAFHNPEFAPGYFNHFANLCSLLIADPRAHNEIRPSKARSKFPR